ncbi:IMPACT family protein [Myceligenerans pegani]|uniref:YigZ family protein n=1 Tax=Myceligenerans pegani TaxID=2776917 RepID=A0ABR9MU56_9MICO|nr:YigZ family protein [Myceligenerans sp. TRM 65318]MBE1874903.1 YigZ family protein [Myceligenerans sp. TRM 65318]MBE3017174.1 YigZ family protein [Myceligenerans sp. TRM 65318]
MTEPALPRTLARPVDRELVTKKSRFLAHLEPVADGAAADAVVGRIRKEFWDARHHCVAMVLGPRADRARSSDDGEPSGTAGVPMLEVLRHRHVTDVVAVVTRYFGGVKLGAGGLVRAYSGAVAAALDIADATGAMLRREVLHEIEVAVPHSDAGRIDNLLRDWAGSHGSVVQDPVYDDVARLRLLVPGAHLDALHADLAAASAGSLSPGVGDSRVVDVPS